MNGRRAAALALSALAALWSAPDVRGTPDPSQLKLIVLGVDGLDPKLLSGFMAEGLVPNLKRLSEQGGYLPLGTSVPPQSPVAWSNFITGMDPGSHGIFDFIGLDRKTMFPYMSTAKVERSGRDPLEIGKWRIPLGSDKTLQLRDARR